MRTASDSLRPQDFERATLLFAMRPIALDLRSEKEWQGTSWAPPDLIEIRSKGVCGDNQRECAVRNLFGSSQHHQYELITAAVRSRACRNLWIAAYARLALAIRNSKQSRSVRRMCHQFA